MLKNRRQALVAAGADVNRTDRWGDTALMDTTRNGFLAAVRVLLRAGADTGARNKAGETAV